MLFSNVCLVWLSTFYARLSFASLNSSLKETVDNSLIVDNDERKLFDLILSLSNKNELSNESKKMEMAIIPNLVSSLLKDKNTESVLMKLNAKQLELIAPLMNQVRIVKLSILNLVPISLLPWLNIKMLERVAVSSRILCQLLNLEPECLSCEQSSLERKKGMEINKTNGKVTLCANLKIASDFVKILTCNDDLNRILNLGNHLKLLLQANDKYIPNEKKKIIEKKQNDLIRQGEKILSNTIEMLEMTDNVNRIEKYINKNGYITKYREGIERINSLSDKEREKIDKENNKKEIILDTSTSDYDDSEEEILALERERIELGIDDKTAMDLFPNYFETLKHYQENLL